MGYSSLTIGERKKLAEHEAVIESGLMSFVDVGNALIAIRDDALFSDVADTFEDYCKIRWGFSRQRAYQLIDASKVVDAMSTIVDIPPPANEGQARVLAALETEQDQATVWTKAVETAPKDKDGKPKVTAAHVRKVAAEVLGEPETNGEAEPAQDGVSVDMLDEPLPKSLIPAFSQRGLAQEIETLLNQAIKKVTAYAALPVGTHTSAQSVTRIIDDAKREVRLNKPYCICPYCRAKRSDACPACKASGWVPKRVYDAAPEEKK